MRKGFRNIVALCLMLVCFSVVLSGCFLFDDTDPADKRNIEQITTKAYTGKSEAKETNEIIKMVGFNDITDISFGWVENGASVYLFVCDRIIVDVGLLKGVVQFIEVSDNAIPATEIKLYDVNSGGFIRSISQMEKADILAKQVASTTTVIENYVASLISLEKFIRTSPNSAGGVDVKVSFKNNSPKPIKYIHMSFFARNAVGDEVYCSIRGKGIRIVSMTGPIEQGKADNGVADCYFYNYSINAIGFNYFEIEYMDGTVIEFSTEMRNAMMRQKK